MQKIGQLIRLIIFFVFVVTSCMAGTLVNQTGIEDPLHHFRTKRAPNCPVCCSNYCGGYAAAPGSSYYASPGPCYGGCVGACPPGFSPCSDCAVCGTSTRPTTTTRSFADRCADGCRGDRYCIDACAGDY
jgi:hypothetical protein